MVEPGLSTGPCPRLPIGGVHQGGSVPGWELMVAVQEAIACHTSFVAMYINPNTKYNTVPSHLMDQGIPPSRVKDSWTP